MRSQAGQHQQVKRFVWPPDFVNKNWPFDGIDDRTDGVKQPANYNRPNCLPLIIFPKQIAGVGANPAHQQKYAITKKRGNAMKENRPDRYADDRDRPKQADDAPTFPTVKQDPVNNLSLIHI